MQSYKNGQKRSQEENERFIKGNLSKRDTNFIFHWEIFQKQEPSTVQMKNSKKINKMKQKEL